MTLFTLALYPYPQYENCFPTTVFLTFRKRSHFFFTRKGWEFDNLFSPFFLWREATLLHTILRFFYRKVMIKKFKLDNVYQHLLKIVFLYDSHLCFKLFGLTNLLYFQSMQILIRARILLGLGMFCFVFHLLFIYSNY